MTSHRRTPRISQTLLQRRTIAGLACGGALAVAALSSPASAAQSSAPEHTAQSSASAHAVNVADRAALTERASRSMDRTAPAVTDVATTPTASDAALAPATNPGAPNLVDASTAIPLVGVPTTSTAPAAPAAPAPATAPAAPAVPAAPAPAAALAAPAAPAAPAPPRTVVDLDPAQTANAATIVKVGRDMGVDARGQIIAVATSLQESQLYNLDVAVDHDSLGLFQQRPSSGWGTPAQLNDPAYAARAFYQGLLANKSDWGCLTCAAQRVQVSAYPDAYAKHEAHATAIVNALNH